MPSSRTFATRARASAVAITAVVAFAGCGKSDISGAEKALNAEIKKQGLPITVNCPNEVGSGKFDCDVTSTVDKKKTSKVKFELTGTDDDTLDVADQQAFQKALLKAGG